MYPLILCFVGLAILGVAWLPSLVKSYPLSYPIVFVGLGALLYTLPLPMPNPMPLAWPQLATHLTEICVIVALTGTGLKIDRPFALRTWRIPLLLATLGMVLTIALVGLTAWLLVGLSAAAAVLLGAVLAPTDPVLAGDVQVGGPGEGKEDAVRFSLTGEAGLNDGLAFPFVYLAIALVPATATWGGEVPHWLLKDVLYRVVVGMVAGWISGKVLAYLIFGLPKKVSIDSRSYGFVAVAITLVSYGLTELAEGYGFLAVFVASVAIRSYERTHHYHREMHDFSDQIERVLIAILLVLFGGAIANGLLKPLTWQGAALGLLLLLVIRPLVGWATLSGSRSTPRQRWVIAGFGIRGIGSFFYLAYALEKARFPNPESLWAITGFVVLVSITIHGILATPVMNWVDREKKGQREGSKEKI
jgi:NhaP-type Na+/H+ or K+/H+ antiporter